MLNIGTVFPAKLSDLEWNALIGALTIIGSLWGVFRIINSKVSKKKHYEDLKEIRNELKELEKQMKDDLECLELANTGSHGKLSAETERYFHILKEQMINTFASFDKKIDILIENAIGKNKK